VLAAALPRFREQAGYTLDDAARILDCGRFKISRIETGQRGIRATELQELLAEYGVDELRRDMLLSLAHRPRQDGWWQSSGHVRCDAYPDFAGLGGAGTTICTYEAQLLPVLAGR
jgi:transcriptional regulator with XRE-family HTH domain